MPSGIVHAACSVGLAAASFGFALAVTGDALIGVACGAGCLAGIAMTPDLDQQTLNRSEHQIIKWTLGLGYLWVMLWYPYACVIPHRSPLSHWPIVGTIGRLLYLSPLLGFAFGLGWKPQFPPTISAAWAWALGGLMLSDAAHWALDTRFGTKSRRRR